MFIKAYTSEMTINTLVEVHVMGSPYLEFPGALCCGIQSVLH